MSSEEEREKHKQVTQAVAQQPQEEFISPDNQPSKDESEVDDSPARSDAARPRET